MPPALAELNTRLEELEKNVDFLALAVALRPRLGNVLNWDASAELIKLALDFMNAKKSRPEDLYSSLFLRALAAFERFARQLVEDAVGRTAGRVNSYEELAEHIRERNIVLTGRLLASIDAPRDHILVDTRRLAENLASCIPGSAFFRLNAPAFVSAVVGGNPPVLEKALANLSIEGWWDAVGRSSDMSDLLGTKGARETAKMARARLAELSRRRNMIAHAGDEEAVLTESDVRTAIQFIRLLATALDQEVSKRLT